MSIDVGQKVPDFTVISTTREQLRLTHLVADKPAVLAFYYFAFSSG